VSSSGSTTTTTTGASSSVATPSTGAPASVGSFFRGSPSAPHVRVVVALGGFAWGAALRLAPTLGRKPRFGHGARAELDGGRVLLGCYHPSQQNMFTGRLTPGMLDEVFRTASRIAELSG
jgi:uracil-DNA glycosylase